GGESGKPRRKPAGRPQAWVEVDLTKPNVAAPAVEIGGTAGSQVLNLRWTATDKNLAAKPITIACAEQPDGPWTPIATGLHNAGSFSWPMPPTVPRRFHIRVEAIDLAGNIGMAQAPVSLGPDISYPSVSILGVEPGGK